MVQARNLACLILGMHREKFISLLTPVVTMLHTVNVYIFQKPITWPSFWVINRVYSIMRWRMSRDQMVIFCEKVTSLFYNYGGIKTVSELFGNEICLGDILFYPTDWSLNFRHEWQRYRNAFFAGMTVYFLVYGFAHSCARDDFVENLSYHSSWDGECCLKSQWVANNRNNKNDH